MTKFWCVVFIMILFLCDSCIIAISKYFLDVNTTNCTWKHSIIVICGRSNRYEVFLLQKQCFKWIVIAVKVRIFWAFEIFYRLMQKYKRKLSFEYSWISLLCLFFSFDSNWAILCAAHVTSSNITKHLMKKAISTTFRTNINHSKCLPDLNR